MKLFREYVIGTNDLPC